MYKNLFLGEKMKKNSIYLLFLIKRERGAMGTMGQQAFSKKKQINEVYIKSIFCKNIYFILRYIE